MALITVDGGGTWWPASGPLLRPGIHETDDARVIQEALECGFDFVSVSFTDVEEPERFAQELEEGQPSVEPAEVEPVLITEPEDGTGKLTAEDTNLLKLAANLQCGLCPDRGPFANRGALSAHRRAKHPEVDPATGAPREPVVQPPLPTTAQPEVIA